MTTDRISLALHHHVEFCEDLDLVVLEHKPSRHVPEVIRHRGGLFPFGRSLGPAGNPCFRYPTRTGVQ